MTHGLLLVDGSGPEEKVVRSKLFCSIHPKPNSIATDSYDLRLPRQDTLSQFKSTTIFAGNGHDNKRKLCFVLVFGVYLSSLGKLGNARKCAVYGQNWHLRRHAHLKVPLQVGEAVTDGVGLIDRHGVADGVVVLIEYGVPAPNVLDGFGLHCIVHCHVCLTEARTLKTHVRCGPQLLRFHGTKAVCYRSHCVKSLYPHRTLHLVNGGLR